MTAAWWVLLLVLALLGAITLWDLCTKGTRAQQADTELAVDYMRALKDPTDWGRVRAEKDDANNDEWWQDSEYWGNGE